MKKIFLIIFIFCSFVSFGSQEHKVIKIIDGDTVYIDFNDNNIPEKEEKVRINGIDTFETKLEDRLYYQTKKYNLTEKEALGMGYLGKEFAKKELLNKKVKAEYSAENKSDIHNRRLMSIYYDCNYNGICKNYEQEILRYGYAVIYDKSNLADELKKYENLNKLKKNIEFTHKLDLLYYNNATGRYHKLECKEVLKSSDFELKLKPLIVKDKGECWYNAHRRSRYKTYSKYPKPDAKDGDIELYFLSPLKQKKPENICKTSACRALLYNIDNAKKSIDFAIYGIQEQDRIFDALVNAKKRGVKIRWVTDLTENKENIYADTYKLMKEITTVNNDFVSQQKEYKRTAHYKIPQTAIMHDKFFIFDNKIVFTGSTNISNTCLTGYNSNVAILINSPIIANIYEYEFEQMYQGKFHNEKSKIGNNEDINIGNKLVSVYFSPKNKISTLEIIPIIKSAKQYIYVPIFYLTHENIIDELINAKQRGVDIKIIVDKSSVEGKYVNISYMKQQGLDVKVENWPGKMHQKSMIIDGNILVLGSMNFTKQGENVNDENSIIIKNSLILTQSYKIHFLKLWNSIK